MNDREKENIYLSGDKPGYLVKFTGDFQEEINKVDYAAGHIITGNLALVAVNESDIIKLLQDVPSIDSVGFRAPFVLQQIVPGDAKGISETLVNPYLNLTGRGVLVGIVDTGIDYLNKEFIKEDGKTRILKIWDQSIHNGQSGDLYIGSEYTEDDINRAIKAKENNEDPYSIVPSKDEVGHGTMLASIIGARGYDSNVKGIAKDCEFVIVKLLPSPSFQNVLKENNQDIIPVYNNTEIVSGLEYLKRIALDLRRPIVLCLAVGSTQGSHNGDGVTSRYLTSLGSARGVTLVAGTGNEGDSEGHAIGYLEGVGNTKTIEISIPSEIKKFSFCIWVRRPDRLSINIISPYGESTRFIKPNLRVVKNFNFVLDGSKVLVDILDPGEYSGEEVINIRFDVIQKGIWKIELMGEIVVKGRFDVWLNPISFLPKGVKILNSNPSNTLMIPSTAPRVVTVAFYNSINNSLVTQSGRGFNTNGLINPDITAPGINVYATSPGGEIKLVSGSSVATAITSGACALLLQWGIVDRNDPNIYTSKIRSYLIYGAETRDSENYPNEITGFGFLSLKNTFEAIAGIYDKGLRSNIYEGYIGNLFQRMDKESYNYLMRGKSNG